MKAFYTCFMLCVCLVGVPFFAKAETPDRFQELKEKKSSDAKSTRAAGTFVTQKNSDRSLSPKMGGVVAMDSRDLELFFPRDGIQNPQGNVPNWYFYWIEGKVVDRLSEFNYDKTGSSVGHYNSSTKKLYVGSDAVTDDISYAVVHMNGSNSAVFPGGEGIDLCAMTLAHELKHKSIAETLPNTLDSDGDGLPDLYELSLQYDFYTTESDTYNLASIDGSYASYGDQEFLCRIAEASPVAVQYDRDWSDTNGINYKSVQKSNQAVMVLGGASSESDQLDPALALAELLDLLPTVTLQRKVDIIRLLGQRSETGALDTLIRIYNNHPVNIGMDYRPVVKIEILRAISEIGGRSAKIFLMNVIDGYWARGPQCKCARCTEAALYPHHDGDYARCFAAALFALKPWATDEDVRFVYEKVSEDIDNVRLGRIRAIAYRCLLEGQANHRSALRDEETRLILLVEELAEVGVCEPAKKYIIEDNVGKMSWKGIRNQAIESMIQEVDESHIIGLEESLQSRESLTPSKRAAIKRAIEVLHRKRTFREANASGVSSQ